MALIAEGATSQAVNQKEGATRQAGDTGSGRGDGEGR